MTRKIHLTFPPSHTDEDIQYLYDEYRMKFPDRFQEWVEIEKTFTDPDQNPLREIQVEGLKFIQEVCEWDSTFAIGSAWFDLRLKVIDFAKSN